MPSETQDAGGILKDDFGLKQMAAWSSTVFIVGVVATALFGHNVFLSLAVGIVGLITFYGILEGDGPVEGRIRRAITLTIVVVYAMLMATSVFFDIDAAGVLLYVTITTCVVVVFYFASSVYLESQQAATPAPRRSTGSGTAKTTRRRSTASR